MLSRVVLDLSEAFDKSEWSKLLGGSHLSSRV